MVVSSKGSLLSFYLFKQKLCCPRQYSTLIMNFTLHILSKGSFHSESLACASLPIGEDADILPINSRLYKHLYLFENLRLSSVRRENAVVVKLLGTWGLMKLESGGIFFGEVFVEAYTRGSRERLYATEHSDITFQHL